MATAKQKAWREKFGRMFGGKKKKNRIRRSSKGGNMAKRGRKKSGGFGMSKDPLDAFLAGAGTAAMSKRFVGQLPVVGQYTGMAVAGGYAFIRKKNLLATVAGAAVHDLLGNVGGAGGNGQTVY